MNAIVVSAILGVVMMYAGILSKSKEVIRYTGIAAISILLIVNLLELYGTRLFSFETNNMLEFGTFGLLFNTVLFASMLFFVLVSGKDIAKVGNNDAEYYALMLFILCGTAIVSSYNSLLLLFLGIEIISIPLYILTGSDKRNLKSNEASLKYFLMGSFSTGLMLMGITLIYGSTGSFSMDIVNFSGPLSAMVTAGLLLLFFSMAFKVSAVPFHFWTPDVYDGAPTVFTSFMATIVKAGVFMGFIRLFQSSMGDAAPDWQLVAAIITAATLIIGNITAIFQQSVKRMLAYSSIAQAGFMLFAIVAVNERGREGLLFYAAAYCIATIGIFAVLARLKDYTFEGFNGLSKHHPTLAFTTAVFLLSLAGIPATAGFMAKFYMLSAAVAKGNLLWLVLVGVVCAAISVYYYFRVIQAMYFREGERQELQSSASYRWMLGAMAVVTILLGIFPEWLLDKLVYFVDL
jgi:NADH-quinone oxidoreductase subunit N